MTVHFFDDDAVDVLTRLLQATSPCGQEDAVAKELVSAMRRAGFDAGRDAVGNVVGDTGVSGGKHVVLLGHMDTVPGVIPVEQRDGALYGRGSVDAKGPLAAALVAASRAAPRTRCRLTVIGAVQEEGPSVGARFLASHMDAPDYLVILEPSGWDALVLGYKGSQRLTVRIEQNNGHTAGPERSAPERAVQLWTDLVRWCESYNRDRGTSGSGFDSLTATLIGVSSENDGLSDEASLHIGLRLPPGLQPDQAMSNVESLIPTENGVRWEIRAADHAESAVRGEKGNSLVAGFLRSMRQESAQPRFKVKTGTSDMNVVGPVWRCPMLAYGPGDSSLDHTPQEHVMIDEYLKAVRVLTRVLEEL